MTTLREEPPSPPPDAGPPGSPGASHAEPPHAESPRPEATSGSAVRGFAWTALSYGGSRLLIFGMTLALARLLTPEEFGVVAGGMAIILFLEIGLDLGLGASLVYDQERGITRRVQTAFTVNLMVAAALTLAAVLAAPAVAALFRAPEEAALYRVLFLYLLVRGLTQVPDAVLKRDLGFRRRAGVDMVRVVIRVSLALWLAANGAGAWSIVVSLLAGEAVAAGLTWWLVRFWPTFELDRTASRQLLGFGMVVLALKVVDAAALDSDYIVIGARLGTTDLGYYTIGYRLPELLLFNLYWIFSTVAFPIYSRYRDRGGDALAQAMLQALRLITLFSFPAGVGLALVSRDAIQVLFGPTWAPAALPMALIALTTALGSVGYASGDIFLATGRPGTLLALNIPVTVVLVMIMVIVAPAGIAAVAAVHLAVSAFTAPVRLVMASRQVGGTFRANVTAMWPGFAATLGVLALAGPVRLLLPPGASTLGITIAAGLLGGAAATWLFSRSAVVEVTELARRVARG